MQYYYVNREREGLTDRELWRLAVIFGIYLGQSLLYNHLIDKGYSWRMGRDKVSVLDKDDRNQMSPITRVYKRLLNGVEDSVVSFYDISILITDGKVL